MPFHLPWPARKDKPHDKAEPPETRIPSGIPQLLTRQDNSAASPESTNSRWTRVRNFGEQITPYAAVVFALGAASGVGGATAWRRWGKRLRSSEWVTPDVLARRRWVRGVVTSVGDADNFRLYHTPGIGWRWPLKFRRVPTTSKDLKDKTIHIRIAGVDAPEGGHFGRPSQPYAQESLAWLKNRIEGRTIYCQLIRKDQYSRIVGVPLVPRRFLPLFLSKSWGSPLALEMLRAGTVTTYEQAGAEHGPWGREVFLRLEAEARANKKGMWKNAESVETPAEYKRRYAATTVLPTSSPAPPSLEPERPGLFLRLWKW
ncbi:staphylococcal nuclease [Paxillus ammoniavirescens]|nr:staphylococcal nuclease [Paxillus ammoniavirescens]